jgi:tetratricopeptide (TPR) repeat protein
MKKLLLSAATIGLLSSLQAEPLSQPVLERYEQMLLGAPESGTAFDKVYQHYLETEGIEALAQRWREASGRGGATQSGYLLVIGLLEDRRGKTEEALKALREAAETGASWRGWAALAEVEGRAGRLKEAIESYQKALGLHPPKDALAKLYRGLALSQQRQMDFTGAVETWEAYAKAAPDDPFVLEEAGDALLDAGRYDEARAMFTALRDMKDVDPSRKLNASLRLAEVARQQGGKEEALKIYDAALAESGEASWLQREVRSRIERLFRSDDDLPGLAAYYEKRLKSEPGDLEAALRLSETLAELNRADEALNVLQAAAAKAPDRKDLQLKLAAGLLRAERAAEAQTALEALEKKYPADGEVITQLGEARWMAFKLGRGEKSAALATWKKLAPEGADANAVQRLAEILRAHELADEAVAEYRRALELDPSANDRRERLAEYLMALDRKPEAMAALEGLVADGRASGENYLRLAKIQRRFGDDAAARRSLEAAGSFADRAFERQYLLWQLTAEAKSWEEAEKLALQMRAAAATDPEIERADDCLVESFRELKKTDGEIRRLLDLQKAAPAEFAEADWRLLFVLALASNDNGTAEFALGEGLRQFPKSAGLSKLENAFARRTNDAERRLASLERLEKIEPQRAADWKAERVRALREAERWEEAVTLAQAVVALSPAKADGHLLLADTLLAAQRKDEAVKALKEAVRLSENPNQVRLRLADLYIGAGENAAARDVMEEAFEAEESPAGKLQLTGRLASVYLYDGKLDTLIEKLRARQKAEQGGWRYAMYLSEVYLMMQDTVRAMEELDKALAGKPDDPVLLKRLFSMAETNNDTEAALRYARKIAAVEPSKTSRAQLGEALANDGKLDEALLLIRENSSEFLDEPSAWQDVVRALQAEEKTGELAVLLEGKLKANPDDWRSLMALAEILMGAGQTERAAGLLWRVVEMKEAPAAPSPQPSPSPAPAAAGYSGARVRFYPGMMMAGGGMPSYTSAQMRQIRFNEIYQRAMQLLATDPNANPSLSRARFRSLGGLMPQQTAPSLSQAQDDAIIYLASIAARDAKEEAYLEKLSAALEERSLEERIEIYNMLQAPEPTLAAIEAALAAGEIDPKTVGAAYNAVQMMVARRNHNALAGVPVPDERLKALTEKLGKQMSSAVQPQNAFQRFHMLNSLGKKEEAEKLVEEILADVDSTDPQQVMTAMQFALMRKNYDLALEYRAKLEAARKTSGQTRPPGQDFGLAMALLATETHREKALDLLAEEFVSPATGLRMIYGSSRQQIQWPQLRSGSVAQYLPLPTADLDQQRVNVLRSLGMNNPQMRAALPDLAKRFEALGKKDKNPALRQAAIWLQWYAGDQEKAAEAMKALLAVQPADDVALNYAMMLFELKKTAEALKVLEAIQARSGDTFEVAVRLRLAAALQEDNQAAAKAAALKLQNLRLVDYEQRELVQQLNRLGLTEEAARLGKKIAVSRNPGQRTRQMADVMRERMESGDRGEAVAIAHALLARDPFSRSVRNERYQQDQAVRTLKKFGELDPYIDKLKTQLAEAPDSARLNAQLAQALQARDPKSAEPYYRKLSELRPKDPEWLQQFGNILMQSEQYEEAMRMYDRILLENPTLLFAQGTNFLEPYRRTKSWQRLVEAIAKSPDPKPDPLNPYRQNFSHVFLQIGKELQRARPPVDPTDVWLKGLRWDENGAAQLRPTLAQALVRAGRNDEARTVIEEAFFPPGRDASSSRLFVYNRQYRPNALWGQWSSFGNGEIESSAVRLMRTAAGLGLLQDLLPRIDKIPTAPDGSEPRVLARLVLRDESVLPDIRRIIAAAKDYKPGLPNTGNLNINTLRIMANELAGWPAGREFAYQTLEAAASLNPNDYNAIMGIHLQRARMAAEDGKTEVARKALKSWLQAQKEWQRQGAQIDFMSSLPVLKSLAAAGMDEEVKGLRDTLKADRNYGQNTHYQRMLRQTENEIAINLGQTGDVIPSLAWMPGSNGGHVIWDLRPSGGQEEDERTIWMSDQPLRKASGKYAVEVFFGESESSMKRLFAKSAAPARGEWTGKLPGSRGYLRAVLRQGENMILGPTVFVASGKLLQPPDSLEQVTVARGGAGKGWSSVPATPAALEKGGPSGSGKYLRIEGDRQNEMELVAERIPIDPKKNYVVGCWFRYQQNAGNTRVGWRIYDAAGKEINNYSGNGNFQGDRWNYATQRFGRGNHFSGLGDKAAFLEPYVEFSGRCDLQGMFVTEIESAPED